MLFGFHISTICLRLTDVVFQTVGDMRNKQKTRKRRRHEHISICQTHFYDFRNDKRFLVWSVVNLAQRKRLMEPMQSKTVQIIPL